MQLLATLRAAIQQLAAMFEAGSKSTIRDVIIFVRTHNLAMLDDRLISHLIGETAEADEGNKKSERAAVEKFLDCCAVELWGYHTYIEGQSPFDTQQGVKGAEFERVLVVLDDEESNYKSFSYGKYFGIIPLSKQGKENIADGADSVRARTRRLFYVCCSRATQDLAVVFFVPDVETAKAAIIARNFFPESAIYDAVSLRLLNI